MSARLNKNKSSLSLVEESPDLEALIGYNLKRAYVIFQADFRQSLEKDGLSARSFSALSLVVQFPDITQSALAKRLGIERSGLVAIVDTLEDYGYVQRTHVPGDRRVQALVATKAGSRAYLAAIDKVRHHETELLTDFSDTEKRTLMKLLKKVRRHENDE